ncbi:acyclic terpene utilization AtuA family protein [Pseudoroseomonas wenyumeiae]
MGSIDVGPYYLGSGNLSTAAAITHRDLRLAINGAHSIKVPLVLGTAGTAGAASHLEKTLEVVRRIAREEGRTLRVATIRSDIDRSWLKKMAGAQRVRPIGNIPPLNDGTIERATNIVGQAGSEAFIRALQLEPDIVVAGRACDTSVFAAIPLMLGYPAGPTIHMAKIIECTSICCDPGGVMLCWRRCMATTSIWRA